MEQLTFRYSAASLMGDYIRSSIGLVVTTLPASQLQSDNISFWLLSVFALLFVSLAAHTIWRHTTRIVMTDEKIESFPRGNAIEWKNVREVKLSYFSTRADRKNGWMQLTINSGDRKLRMDSSIDNFQTIVSGVLDQIRYSEVLLSETTNANFDALGLARR